MPQLQLANPEARLVYLATAYHLGRPGSETDAITLERHRLGLGPVHEVMQPHLESPGMDLELSEYQLHRLGEALLGVINELKQYELALGRSAVPGFGETLHRVFPEVTPEDPGAALDLAGQAMMLRRRLDGAVRRADEVLAVAQQEQAATLAGERSWWRRLRRLWPR